jgi:prepilin-type N-terminal cleavage/methylation domain-containing protein
MKNTPNKIHSIPHARKHGRKIRGAFVSPQNSAARCNRRKRGACDSPGGPVARPRRAGLWKVAGRGTGFTVVEVLISLAIAAILLASVAVAINASAINYSENEKMFKTINCARQALFRMTTQLRTANAVEVDVNAPNAPTNDCTFQTPELESITYEYRSADNKLYLITNSDSQEYVLCDNVTAMTFTKNTVLEDAMIKVKSVLISITVQIGDSQRTIASAAVVRRNLN